MAELISGLLVIVSVFVVLFPLFRVRHNTNLHVGATVSISTTQRKVIYDEMRTLHQAFEAGNIDHTEYQCQLDNLKIQAARALQEQERLEQHLQKLDRQIEIEIDAFSQMYNEELAADGTDTDIGNGKK